MNAAACGRYLSLLAPRLLAAFALCLAAAGPASAQGTPSAGNDPSASAASQYKVPEAPARSVVYTVHEAGAIEHYEADAARVRTMVDRLVLATTGKDSVPAAWRSLVDPKDVVGIKISATGGASGSTHHAVVATIVEGLKAAGVPVGNILVWDRDTEDLENAGYLSRDGHTSLFTCPVQGIAPRWGYDPKDTYTAPYMGKLIWGDLDFKGRLIQADAGLHDDLGTATQNPLDRPKAGSQDDLRAKRSALLADANLSNASHYCTILSRRVTKIVNVPVFSDNYFAGIAGALYNVTIPNIDNWRRLVGQPHYGVPAIPEMYSDPQLGGKIVINIADGLIAQIAGGPAFQPEYARQHSTLYASRDAVALDATLLRQLETWRAAAHLPPLGDSAAHVRTCAEIGLGNFAPDKIDVHAL